MTSNGDLLNVACPTCSAPEGKNCRGINGREFNDGVHTSRVASLEKRVSSGRSLDSVAVLMSRQCDVLEELVPQIRRLADVGARLVRQDVLGATQAVIDREKKRGRPSISRAPIEQAYQLAEKTAKRLAEHEDPRFKNAQIAFEQICGLITTAGGKP